MYTQEQKSNFLKVAESLKKYRRADILEENGKSILDKLYVDLLPNNMILEKCLLDNTTFLVGRKGTGKSTIFLKLENEFRKKKGYLPCYIDVKTLFESSQAQPINLPYLNDYFSPVELRKYLLERTFIQSILDRIYAEIDNKQQSMWELLKSNLTGHGKSEVKEELDELINRINNNNILSTIELPILQQMRKKVVVGNQKSVNYTEQFGLDSLEIKTNGLKINSTMGVSSSDVDNESNENEVEHTDIFLKVFEIKKAIQEIKKILLELNIKHLVILLDDVSEIDESALKVFIDTIVAPLNNWSDEFIKFKIAFYPNRIHYGNIDPSKIDIIQLDFYELYSSFDVNKMEENAILFTERLLNNRFSYYTTGIEQYFDTSKLSMSEYYSLLFRVSMNVPRIMGYILSYAYQSRTIYDREITKLDIENASVKYFDEKINAFFEKSVYCLLSLKERRNIEEL